MGFSFEKMDCLCTMDLLNGPVCSAWSWALEGSYRSGIDTDFK